MKLLSYLFAFYLLLLACWPCSDRDECDKEPAQLTTAATGHQQHNHTTEACTPFCTCACCAAFILLPQVPSLQAGDNDFTSTKADHQADYTFINHRPIWQPPRTC